MTEALALAREAAAAGEIPVGCVVTDGTGAVIGRGRNRREEGADATAHAEIEAIREACRTLGTWRLDGCTMFVTLEPCVMCAGAIAQSRIDTVIFGAFDDALGCAGSRANLPADPNVGGHAQCAGGLRKEPCAEVLQRYFEKKRKE